MLTSFMAFVVRYLVLGLAAAAVVLAEPAPRRAPEEENYSGIRIAPGFIASPISFAVQSPPSSFFVTPVNVTTFISAMRPPPTKKVLPVSSLAASLAARHSQRAGRREPECKDV